MEIRGRRQQKEEYWFRLLEEDWQRDIQMLNFVVRMERPNPLVAYSYSFWL
jgi:hypothetical protein